MREDSLTTIRTTQHLNSESSGVLKKELLQVLEQGLTKVVVDMRETRSIDSSGLGKLLLFNEKFTEIGGTFSVINVQYDDLVRLFQVIRLDKFINITYKSY